MTTNIIRTIAHDINNKNKTLNEECIDGLVNVLSILEEMAESKRIYVLMFCLKYLENFEGLHDEWERLLKCYEETLSLS